MEELKEKIENVIFEMLNSFEFEVPKDEYSIVSSELADDISKLDFNANDLSLENAVKAKNILIKFLEKNVDLDYTELYNHNRNAEKLLYLALRQTFCCL